ncbi:MAG: topology modulation protein [Candidatus Sphingomonas colombiensis]|nr:topology modulation protein [Sphingomonas sp.]WEK43663.1 MAG: topology modulation protein [Sphingomonas sp.]
MTRRVMVMGGPGSGKSTLARAIGARLGVPVFHLDRLYHLPGWEPRPAAEFADEVTRVAGLPGWVIDGNYSFTAAPRLAAADLLVYLDLPRWLTFSRILRRNALGYGRERADAAEGCRERFDREFLRYAWRWREDIRPRVELVRDCFDGRVETLRTRREVAAFLASIDAR